VRGAQLTRGVEARLMHSAGEKKARSAGCSNYVSKAPQPMSTTGKNQAIPVLSLAFIAAAH
jgi:hypothetical protein